MAEGNQMADLTAKQAAQGAMILAVKEPKDYYDISETNFRYTPEDYQVMGKLGLVKYPIWGSRDRRRKTSPSTKRRAQVCYQFTRPDPLGGQETKRCG